MEWISVKEKPRVSARYLCRVIFPAVGGGYRWRYMDLNWTGSMQRWDCDEMIVTHWMPLPEPPKEEEK